MPIRKLPRGRLLIVIALLLAAFISGSMVNVDWRGQAISFLNWLEGQGAWAPWLFILVDAASVTLLLPCLALSLAAGFMFGPVQGGLCVIAGSTAGAVLAFLIARHLRGSTYAHYFLRDHRLQLIGLVFRKRGWGTILLTRLIPFFPFKLSNYFFGLAGYRLMDFVAGTALGIMPITFCNTYLGSLASNLALLGTPTTERSPLEWSLYGLGLVAILGLFISVTHVAQRIFHHAAHKENHTERPKTDIIPE